MEFEKLSLDQYRCFEDESVEFEPGVTVIYGRNGAGKSTVLEACFFALYGSDALRQGNSTLEDILMTDRQTTSVRLRFRHGGSVYTVTREVRERSGRVTQAVCELDGPSQTVSGATDVDHKIQSLIRMDATAFLNCAYVQQGNIQKLITASSTERRDLIDRLLQLGRLETYKQRASDIRVGVGRVQDTKQSLLTDRKESISQIQSANPYDKRESLAQKRTSLQSEIDEATAERERLSDEKDEAEATIESHREITDEIESLDDQIQSCESDIEQLRTDRQDLIDDKDTHTDVIEHTESKLQTIVEESTQELPDIAVEEVTQVEQLESSLREEKTDLTETLRSAQNTKQEEHNCIERASDRISELQSEIQRHEQDITETEQRLHSTLVPEKRRLTEKIETANTEIERLKKSRETSQVSAETAETTRDELVAQRDELLADQASFKADTKAAEDELQRARELKSAGKCPECGQEVDGSPHVERIGQLQTDVQTHTHRHKVLSTEIEQVDNKIETIKNVIETTDKISTTRSERDQAEVVFQKQTDAIAEARNSIEETRTQIESLRSEIDEQETDRETHANEATQIQRQIDNTQSELSQIEEKIAVVTELLSVHTEHENALTQLDALETQAQHKAELISQQKETLDAFQSDRDSLSANLDEEELNTAVTRVETISAEIADVDSHIDAVTDELGSVQQATGELDQTISRLEGLKEEHTQLQEEVEAVSGLYDELESVEELYASLRGDLRQDNVRKLEVLLNEMFEIVYQNDSYDRITLDGEYNASVVQKNSQELAPQKLSGGESALFNLSLRCAIYQLLVQGIEGTGAMPPLIFDEPTAHLDQGHVNQIDDIVRRMRDIGVEQTIVVSHDDEIIGSSNHRIHVEEEQASNHSHISVDQAIQL